MVFDLSLLSYCVTILFSIKYTVYVFFFKVLKIKTLGQSTFNGSTEEEDLIKIGNERQEEKSPETKNE